MAMKVTKAWLLTPRSPRFQSLALSVGRVAQAFMSMIEAKSRCAARQ